VKIQKSHYRQVPCHAYSTNIQTSNQVLRDQKPIKKAQNTLELRKLYKKFKFFHKICAKRVHDSPPHLNLKMSSLEAEEPQPTRETHKTQNNLTYTQVNTNPKQNLTRLTTRSHMNTNTTNNQKYTKPKTLPITKHNYAQRHIRVIIAINWLYHIPNISSKLITNKITILNIHHYVQKERKKEKSGKKEKREQLE